MEEQAKSYVPGQRWHKTPSGVVKICTAKVRSCPYGQHFDTQEEAQARRQRVARNMDPAKHVVKFSSVIGEGPRVENPNDVVPPPKTLREASARAKEKYFANGLRPCSPLGDIAVYLPRGRKITLRRESFDRTSPDPDQQVAARYYIRYFDTDKRYYDQTAVMGSPADFHDLDFKLHQYITDSSEGITSCTDSDELDAIIVDRYEKMMQTIAEVEIMARGADRAHQELGVDLFDHETRGALNLTSSYSDSVIQTYDIVDSLKVHASTDDHVKKVTLTFTEEIPNSKGSKWVLNRMADGDWYFGADSSRATAAKKITSPEEATSFLTKVLEFYKVPEEDIQAQARFVTELYTEVEPAIKSYERTVEAKSLEQTRPLPVAPEKKSFADKVFGMFS